MTRQGQQECLEQELSRIMSAVEILGSGRVSLASRDAPILANTNVREAGLQALLYQHCYCNRFGHELELPGTGEQASFEAALDLANSSQNRWLPGWQIAQVLTSGQIIATRGAVTRLPWPGEFMSHSSPGMAPQAGTPISLFAPRGSATIQAGYYFAFGETLGDWQDQEGIVRIYFNVRPDGAARLTKVVTASLNRFTVPFHFKCLSNPASFPRSDAAVLYISRRLYRITAELLAEFASEVAGLLGSATPLFTKALAPGIGLAEDPGTGESFGMHRCRLVAEAIWQAHGSSDSTTHGRLAALQDAFTRNGLTTAAPYLNPGSRDDYPFRTPQ
jgi:hypothetical protein